MKLQTAPHIGNIIRNAIVFNSRNWDGSIMNADSLLQTVAELFALLDQREVAYVLVGGIALLKYVEGRNTEDIDLIMAVAALEKVPEIEIHSKELYFARGRFKGLQIDLLLTDNPLFAYIQQNEATPQAFAEQMIPTATVDGLLLLKLYALPSLYRQGNFAKVGIYENDIATLMHYYQPDISALIEQLRHYLSLSDMNEIVSIVAEIEQRLARFRPPPAA